MENFKLDHNSEDEVNQSCNFEDTDIEEKTISNQVLSRDTHTISKSNLLLIILLETIPSLIPSGRQSKEPGLLNVVNMK